MSGEIVSDHAKLRLMQRTQLVNVSVAAVWDDAVPCEVDHHGYDEARVSPEHGVVLLKQNGQIVTCLNDTHNVTIDGSSLDSYLESAINEDDQ